AAVAERVQAEQRVEGAVEAVGPVDESVAELVPLREAALLAADLLAEVPAAAGEELVPGLDFEVEDRAAAAGDDARTRQREASRQLLPDEQIEPLACEAPGEHVRGQLLVAGRVDRAELVAGAVPREAQDPQRPPAPPVERHDHPGLGEDQPLTA